MRTEKILISISRRLCALCCLGLLIALAAGCGTNKNTSMSRNWQAFTTRYNVYFNGDEHYKETLGDMEKKYEDDYTRLLMTHPAEARNDNKMPQPTGDFTRTIEKMQKAIQLHSIKKKPTRRSGSAKEKAFRARDEFNPFLHNAWMMLGKGQFFNGDFLGAAVTFNYISKHFVWLPATVTEARLWEARSYCAMDWDYEADNILRRVKEKDLTNKKLVQLYNETKGDYLVRTDNYAEALPFLRKAAEGASGSQKNRLWFLTGQVCRLLNRNKEAYEAFKKAGAGASTPYRTKFNARIKQSEVYQGRNIEGEVRALRALARYERNNEYLDQIYYAIGNLYLSRKDTAKAKENYSLALEKSTRNGIDKALAALALGDIYFNEKDYVKAQPCYSEAVPKLSDNYPDYKMLKRRSDVLDELAVYAGNVQLQDSLLDLSKLSEEEQMKVCERLANELKKKEKEEEEARKREEFLANNEGSSPMSQQTPTTGFQLNSDKSWYFYNEMTKNAGKTEFQRRWGSRKLEDDWRRRNKTSFAFDSQEPDVDDAGVETTAPTDSLSQQQKDSLNRRSDPHYPEYYMQQIPRTEEQIAVANDVIQEGLYNMGIILKDKLDDYPAARDEFMQLDKRYPDNQYRLDVYYNMYLMAVRQDDNIEAEKWRRMILEEFPDSPYGQAMQDPDYFIHLREMHVRQEQMYTDTYNDYLADKNKSVHERVSTMEKDYPLSPILPKFVFLDALSYLTQGDYDQFKERLSELLKKWPDTDMTDMAGNILRGINSGRKLHSGESNSRGLIWDIRLSDNQDAAPGSDGQPANFERDPNSPQYLVLAFPRDSVSANQVLYDVARFNFSSFVVRDFDLEPMSFGNVGMLIIKGFRNIKDLEHYRKVMAEKDFVLPDGVRPIMISKPNFELLLREGRSFDEYFRFEEEEVNPLEQPADNPDEDVNTDESDNPDENVNTDESDNPDDTVNADETDETLPEEEPAPDSNPDSEPDSNPDTETEENNTTTENPDGKDIMGR